jgi:hypothetical protein
MKLKVKSFVENEVKTRQYGERFVVDGGWLAQAVATIGIKDDEVVDLALPHARPFVVLMIQVGRGRRFRYVASDGVSYADVHGEAIPGWRSNRRQWCKQKGPWKLVSSYRKGLDQNAKVVVNLAVDYWWKKEAK